MPDKPRAPLSRVEAGALALALEGLSTDDVAQVLGLDLEVLQGHLDSIREKLGLPMQEPVEASVKREFQSLLQAITTRHHEGDAPAARDERRVRLLLRMTLSELSEVARNAAMRAELLATTVDLVGSEDMEGALSEIDDLRNLSTSVTKLYDTLISVLRKRR